MRTSTISGVTSRFLERPDTIKGSVKVEFRTYQTALIILDLFLVYLAFQVSYVLRFQAGLNFFNDSIIPDVPLYTNLMLSAVPVWIAIFAITGLYNTGNLLGGTREYALLFNATAFGMLLIISAGFLFPDSLILARGWVVLAWLLTFLFTLVGRFSSRRVIYALRRQGRFQVPGIIVGGNDEAHLLAEQFVNSETSGVRVLGYIADQALDKIDEHTRHMGKLEDLDKIVEKYGIVEIILSGSALHQEQILALFRKYGTSDEINLRMSSGLYEIITTGMRVEEVGLVPLLVVNKVRMTGVDQALKLIMDYAITIPGVLLLSPVFALLALLVRISSPGPIIYRRRVMGVNGREFDAFKFRTMRVDGDALLDSDPALMKEYLENFKIKDDPRVTPIGKLLRKTSLDELPQLLNVLRNEMSLVGPRMICPDELAKYDQWDINLLTVKPGITGLWQVRGRSDVSYEERVRMDMFYIRNWTIWLDIQLLLQTIPAVLTHRGAY
jgi:exopolysaccharide biosynthesis polyprenyl glycosylphosphotransferase